MECIENRVVSFLSTNESFKNDEVQSLDFGSGVSWTLDALFLRRTLVLYIDPLTFVHAGRLKTEGTCTLYLVVFLTRTDDEYMRNVCTWYVVWNVP